MRPSHGFSSSRRRTRSSGRASRLEPSSGASACSIQSGGIRGLPAVSTAESAKVSPSLTQNHAAAGSTRTGRRPNRRRAARPTSERRRRTAFPSSLHRAADDYIVARGGGKTIIAGYPWFSDWGRDTFIALRGLCLSSATAEYDRFSAAREILLEWAEHVSEGMLPNFFPEVGRLPEYNSVDASLWYVIAVHEFLQLTQAERPLTAADRRTRPCCTRSSSVRRANRPRWRRSHPGCAS